MRIANTSPNAAADAFHTAALALTYVYNAYVVKYASVAVDQAGHFEDADNWRALSKDASFLSAGGAVAELADRPLWPDAVPPLAAEIWARLKAGLPTGEDWDVWIRWYDERLRGAPSHGEAYELVFATVPIKEWDKGHASANRWIKEHLPKEPKVSEASRENGQENELLKQKAAPFAFRVVNGKIDVAPEDAVSIDEQVARDFHAEAKRKAAELKERLARAQADKRLQDSLARLEDYLGQNVDDILYKF